MKKLICMALFWGGSLLASPCTTAALSVYTSTGFTCTMDSFTIQDVFFAVGATNLTSPLTASAITITPSITPTVNGDLLGLAFSSGGFSVASGKFVNYEIRYNIDPPPDIIVEMDDQLNTNTPVSPGFAKVDTKVCVGGKWLVDSFTGLLFCDTPGTVKTLKVFHNGTPSGTVQLSDLTKFPGVHIVGVDNLIVLDAQAGGSSSITGLTNIATAAPEPSSVALVLSALGLFAARRFRSKVR